MMGGLSLNRKETIVKAIFISVFLHTAVLGTVVFSFTISQGYSKPFFVFLGSILPKQDFILPGGGYARAVNHIQPSRQILMVSNHPLYPAPISKPSFSANISYRGKTLLKAKASESLSFPNASVGNPDEDVNGPPTKTFGGDNFGISSKKKLRIELKIPPYVPLKPYTR